MTHELDSDPTYWKNGSGILHENKRQHSKDWYENKELFEMLQRFGSQLQDAKTDLREFNFKFEKYNGMQDRLMNLEMQPCRQVDSLTNMQDAITSIEGSIRDILNALSTKETEEETKKRINDNIVKYTGWAVGVIGGSLGIMGMLGLLH